MFKHTKIGATIGPSCDSPAALLDMAKAGMNFARLNFAHGDYGSHEQAVSRLRAVEKEFGHPIAIMQDLPGPKIRLGILPSDGVVIKSGEMVNFVLGAIEYKNNEIPIDNTELENYIKVGERMLIDDGHAEVKIVNLGNRKISAEVIEGAKLLSHKGVNFPDSILSFSVLDEKNKRDLRFGVQMGVDLVAVSFVSCAQDIIDVRYLIKQYEKELKLDGSNPIAIVAKIERHEAVHKLAEIIDAADGLMVARGDLGLEMPAAEVPMVQKKIIDACNAKAKPVIVATQMLDSMQNSRRPTRAEVSDVANAVIDHADALLLTNETAAGKYPVLTVKTMSDIITAAEKSTYDRRVIAPTHKVGMPVDLAIAELSQVLASEVEAKVILAASITGETGRLISHVRPNIPVLVATSSERVWRQLIISWGVNSFILPQADSIEELIERSVSYIKNNKLAKVGDRMIIVAGEPVGQAGNVNLVEVRDIK